MTQFLSKFKVKVCKAILSYSQYIFNFISKIIKEFYGNKWLSIQIFVLHSYSAASKVKATRIQKRLKDMLWHRWTFCSHVKNQSAMPALSKRKKPQRDA